MTGQPTTTPLTDVFGHRITDPFGQPGFSGFDGMSAAVSLAYVLAIQEAGIPITYGYISDAHDVHGVAGNTYVAFGPGDKGYVDQLQAYDAAFATFFERLEAVGITKRNTLCELLALTLGDRARARAGEAGDGGPRPDAVHSVRGGGIRGPPISLIVRRFSA